MDQNFLRTVISRVLAKMTGYSLMQMHGQGIPVGVSNRHLHLSVADLETLFGAGYQLRPLRPLSQPGQFAAEETVTIAGPKGCLEKVRILGPARSASQVEISRTDAYRLGLNPPVRESGKTQASSPVTLVGPKGSVYLKEGLIIAQRHLHMTPDDAIKFGVGDGERVQVMTNGERSLVFDQVLVRVNPEFSLEFHVDTDEANAAGLRQGDQVYLLTKKFMAESEWERKQEPTEEENRTEPLAIITEETVRSAWKNKMSLVAGEGCIVTPLAYDTIKELGVNLIWGDRDE